MIGRLVDWWTRLRLKRKAAKRAYNAMLQVEQGAAVLDWYFSIFTRPAVYQWHKRVREWNIRTRRAELQGILPQLFPELGHQHALKMLRSLDSDVGFGTLHGFDRRNHEGDLWSEEPSPEEVDAAWMFLILNRQKRDNVVPLRLVA